MVRGDKLNYKCDYRNFMKVQFRCFSLNIMQYSFSDGSCLSLYEDEH